MNVTTHSELIPWLNVTTQHLRSCFATTSRRTRNRTGMIFLRLTLTGRSKNNTSCLRKRRRYQKRPKSMQPTRNTTTTLGQVGIVRWLENGRRQSRNSWIETSAGDLGLVKKIEVVVVCSWCDTEPSVWIFSHASAYGRSGP